VTETETYARELRWILSEAAACLRSIPAEARTWRPLPSANDALTIARHLAGATRGYAVGIGGATAIERDRPAEFRPAGDDDDLVGRIEALEREVADVFSRVSDDDLDLPAVALARWEGREPPSGTRRDVIVEAIRHGGVHLGEIRLTADLAVAAAKGPP
jgi:DinB superfamily